MAKRKTKKKAVRVQRTQKVGKESKSPWVEIKALQHDPEKGLQIELDWNDAFIKYLKSNGIVGSNDEAIVQRWLAALYKDMIEKMNEGKVSEFEQ